MINFTVWNILNRFELKNFIENVLLEVLLLVKLLAKTSIYVNKRFQANNGLKLWQNVSNDFRKISQSFITLI